ncbi:MAG: c-type cytochrome biogenesis protein CcsB, partial [Phycicoccus sp.]
MNPTTLAELSNTAVYSAALVLTLAMVAHALYLARVAPERSAAETPAREPVADRELVAVSGSPGAGDRAPGSPVADPATAGSGDEPVGQGAELSGGSPAEPAGESRMARKSAGVARTLTLLGTALLVAGVVLRAAEVGRWPLGNMYEFAIVGSMSVLVAYSVWSTRRDLRWLGLFVVGPVLVNLGLAIAVWYTDA